MHTFCPLFKPKVPVRILKMDFRWGWGHGASLFAPPPNVTSLNQSSFPILNYYLGL